MFVSHTVLLLPGWHNSAPDHWQSRWELAHGYRRVAQHNWDFPLRGDWITRLEEEVTRHESVVLVAHSLACILVAAWASLSANTQRVHAALLVAPSDVEREEMQHMLHSWSPIVRKRLPFDSVMAVSRNDPYCNFMRACKLASDWGARVADMGNCGHINADSGLGDWSRGHELLEEFLVSVE